MTIEDVTGKSVPAIDVFSLSIKALKDCLFELAETRGLELTMNDITWVLTVPAIWSDSAKEFMKESAMKVTYAFDIFMSDFRNIKSNEYKPDILPFVLANQGF